MAKKTTTPFKAPTESPINPIRDIGEGTGLGHFMSTYLPLNFFGGWTLTRWVKALQRAETLNNLVELDALYSWVFRVSALWNALWNMRSVPFFMAVVDVYNPDGEWNEEISNFFKDSHWFDGLRKEYSMAIATGCRCGAVFDYEHRDPTSGSWISFPLRNLDWYNQGLREGTYQWDSVKESDKQANLFWFQPSELQETRWGLLQSAAKSIINYDNANKNWVDTALLYASPRVKVLYNEGGTKNFSQEANDVAKNVLYGSVPKLPASMDEDGELRPQIDVKGWESGASQDVFRVFGELKQQEASDLSLLVLGSTMLGVSNRSAYSEYLVKAGFKEFQSLIKSDIDGFFRWLNRKDIKTKLAIITGYAELADCEFRYETSSTIDAIDLATYSDFLKNSGYKPTDDFMARVGLSKEDYEEIQEDASTGGIDNQGGSPEDGGQS